MQKQAEAYTSSVEIILVKACFYFYETLKTFKILIQLSNLKENVTCFPIDSLGKTTKDISGNSHFFRTPLNF